MNIASLETKSREIRNLILDMVYNAGSGHIDSSFSTVEILVTLYYKFIHYKADDPNWPERDYLILSKGHAAPTLYAILSDLGFFPKEELNKLRSIQSYLQGHPTRSTPGVETATGSLGQGLSIACGISFANKFLHKKSNRTYVVLSDGELNEGQIWEAAMMASHYRLRNLIAIVDCNGLQYTGATTSVMNTEPLAQKFGSFGWEVISLDGHSIEGLSNAINHAIQDQERICPYIIIAKTIKGKGVSFMENNLEWHGKVPNEELYNQAKKELKVNDE